MQQLSVTTSSVPCPDLDAIMAYQHLGVVRKLQQSGMPESEALQLFDDTKRFLFLAATNPKAVRPTSPVDQGWHSFLLFTRDYGQFCEKHFGRFLHHQPILDSKDGNGGDVEDTVKAAQLVFGENLSPNWFANPAECAPDSNCEAAPSDCALN